MSTIHPTAFVDPKAELGTGVEVGAFSYVGAHVRVGDGCRLAPRVTLLGPAEFGPRNVFYSGCVLGAAPQDLKYHGGPTRLAVGAENIIREHVTAHRGTEVDPRSGGVTRIGDHNLIINSVQLAGHVRIEDRVVVGGIAAMHHFVTVGRFAYVAGATRVTRDVPPYVKVTGYEQEVRGLNIEGLRRWQVPDRSISCLRDAARLLFTRRSEQSPLRTREALGELQANGLIHDEHVQYLAEFVRRTFETGVFGRARESCRRDTDADRASFYRVPGAKEE